jgi:hypothetical protein
MMDNRKIDEEAPPPYSEQIEDSPFLDVDEGTSAIPAGESTSALLPIFRTDSDFNPTSDIQTRDISGGAYNNVE